MILYHDPVCTYGNGVTSGSWPVLCIELAPTLEKLVDVTSSGVNDTKSRDVDGTVLDHFAFPTVVHYLITHWGKRKCVVYIYYTHNNNKKTLLRRIFKYVTELRILWDSQVIFSSTLFAHRVFFNLKYDAPAAMIEILMENNDEFFCFTIWRNDATEIFPSRENGRGSKVAKVNWTKY